MRQAIVCGSGVAGLSAAIALTMRGWLVNVYERDSAVREIGAGIFIKANGLRVLKSFGLLERIRRDCVILQEARTLDKDGNLLQRRPLHNLNPIWNIQRQHLIRALFDRAAELGAQIHTGGAVDAVTPDGTVTVRGRRHHADLIVAADGVSSTIRHQLGLNRPVRDSLSGAIRLLIPRTAYEVDDVVKETWSGRLRIGISPCSRFEVFSYFIAPLRDERGTRIPIDKDYWSEHFPMLKAEGFFEHAAMAAAVHHPYPFVSTRSWAKGCAALVGDAAHALPPTLGQGAGLSLTNTLLLSHYVSSNDELREALAAWEREWRWVSNRTQTWARRYDWITSEWPRYAYPLRDAVIWAIGKKPRFNHYMRIADRIDAPRRLVRPVEYAGPGHYGALD
jgi:2-polyprenyl-6-methoxyphenol hydroxylase-like FAD-dependent oxidoreductase